MFGLVGLASQVWLGRFGLVGLVWKIWFGMFDFLGLVWWVLLGRFGLIMFFWNFSRLLKIVTDNGTLHQSWVRYKFTCGRGKTF